MSLALKTAIKATKAAGELIAQAVGHVKNIDYKGAFNIVTDVDKASEQLIIDMIHDQFPDDSILAEESGLSQPQSTRRWFIDPLDGTTNFAHGYPFFCVSIGLMESGKMALGVVYNPIAHELFYAEAGSGAWLNERQIHVSNCQSLKSGLLATGFPPDSRNAKDNNMQRFFTLTDLSHGVRRDGAAALDLCFVACARLDGFWETKLSPWDVAAGMLIVEEAGGKVTNLVGTSFDLSIGHILATNGMIHAEIIDTLRSIGCD